MFTGSPAACAEGGDHALQQDLRVGILVGGIGVGELVADVGQAGGAEEGVADGVGQGVCI
jgi:broad specificity polyphosphatase/5'/3'-nucleotidase SurE